MKYKTALICDLAETYNIHDWRQYPPFHIATLVAGLEDNSRIKRKIAGIEATKEELLLATITDRVGYIISAMAGQEEALPSMVDTMLGKTPHEKEQDHEVFETPEDFMTKYKQIGGSNIWQEQT